MVLHVKQDDEQFEHASLLRNIYTEQVVQVVEVDPQVLQLELHELQALFSKYLDSSQLIQLLLLSLQVLQLLLH